MAVMNFDGKRVDGMIAELDPSTKLTKVSFIQKNKTKECTIGTIELSAEKTWTLFLYLLRNFTIYYGGTMPWVKKSE